MSERCLSWMIQSKSSENMKRTLAPKNFYLFVYIFKAVVIMER